MGSPSTCRPSRCGRAQDVDARTDIWSLGVILYELLTGHPPFEAERVTELAIAIATERQPPLDEFRSDAPAGLDQVVARCLEKDRARRFQSVGELAVALAGFGTDRAKASVEHILGIQRRAGRSRDNHPAPEPAPARTMGGTTAPASMPSAERRHAPGIPGGRSRAARFAKTVAAVVGGVVLVTVLLRLGVPFARRQPELLDARAQAADVPLPSASSPQPGAAAPPQASPIAASSLVAAQAPPAASATTTAPPRATSMPPGRPPTRPSPPRTELPARPAPTTHCDPPYTIDEHGHHVPKPECL